MNSGLLLLLVAALYTSGCVNAVDITVTDTEKAVKAAYDLFTGRTTNQKDYSTVITLDSNENVAVTCKYFKKSAFNCNLPKGYLLPETETNQVGTWFVKNIAKVYGVYQTPVDKNYGGCYANLKDQDFYGGGKKYELFNYHIEVKPGEKSGCKQDSLESKLLRMLLSRILQ